MPQFINYPLNNENQVETFLLQEELSERCQEDENDRQLVCSLPD